MKLRLIGKPQLDHKEGGIIKVPPFMFQRTMFLVYILYSKSLDGYYVGFTNCIERRLTEHNRKKGKYTDRGIPWELVYSEVFETKREAKEREQFIKSRKSKIYIIELNKQQVEHSALRKGPGFACPGSRNEIEAYREAPAGSQRRRNKKHSSSFVFKC